RADRSDHVDELRDAGDTDPVRAADELVQQSGDEKRILEIVVLFQKSRGFRPVPLLDAAPVFFAIMIPDVPLVEADVDVVLCALLRLDVVDRAGDRLDVASRLLDLAEVVERVLALV